MTINTGRPGCLAALLSFLHLTPKAHAQPQPLPYKTRDDFLSPAEASLFRLISSHLQGRGMVFPKVRLADIFFVARPNENLSHINRIAQRHLDFLVCDATSLCPLAGIELDDTSHARPQRQESDRFLNEVFAAASLPLTRIPAQRTYTAEEVAGFLRDIPPAPTPVAAGPATPEQAPAPPICPKCGIPMVARQVAQGPHKGKRFYGCRNFPQCRQLIAIDR